MIGYLTKIVETGVDLRVVVWIKEFLLGRSQRVRGDGHLSDEVREKRRECLKGAY
jgi:hypothetical protein